MEKISTRETYVLNLAVLVSSETCEEVVWRGDSLFEEQNRTR
jgi:hypothetical protein